MKILDDLIVGTAKAIIRAVFAVGTALVYVQFVGVAVVTVAVGTVAAVAVVALLRNAFLGA